jgi:hypothetical protein
MDLARNIREWVMDSWYLYPGAPVDPQPENDEYGILRGDDIFRSCFTCELLAVSKLRNWSAVPPLASAAPNNLPKRFLRFSR